MLQARSKRFLQIAVRMLTYAIHVLTYAMRMLQVGSERFLKIEKRRASESRSAAESWDKESWEVSLKRALIESPNRALIEP